MTWTINSDLDHLLRNLPVGYDGWSLVDINFQICFVHLHYPRRRLQVHSRLTICNAALNNLHDIGPLKIDADESNRERAYDVT